MAGHDHGTEAKDYIDCIREVIEQAADDARGGIDRVRDPSGRALLETTAEVLGGLSAAYRHYQSRSGRAWRSVGVGAPRPAPADGPDDARPE